MTQPNGALHPRLRSHDSRGPRRDRRSRQVEAMLGPWPLSTAATCCLKNNQSLRWGGVVGYDWNKSLGSAYDLSRC
mgnify:CR=1 FL=1